MLLLIALIATLGHAGITAVGAIQAVVAAPMLGAFLLVARRLSGISVAKLLADMARIGVGALIAAAATTALHQGVGALSDPTSVGALLALGATFSGVYALALALIVPRVADDLRRLRSLAARPTSTRNVS